MAALIETLHADATRQRLGVARERVAAAAARAGRDPTAVQLLVATKYLGADQLPVLAQAGATLVGENRAQDLEAKVRAHGDLFAWDFIGQLQSRKVRAIVPHVRLIHSLASTSALRELERWRQTARPELQVLIEVNLAAEEGKAGVSPAEIETYLERCPVPVAGLMTMPPHAPAPEQSRRWFAALRTLGERYGLRELSMGTSQDYEVAVEEGATIVRLGTSVLA
jgi:pyridoxal phosphate enzyme (YggS family)